jgi:carbonic anhydrase
MFLTEGSGENTNCAVRCGIARYTADEEVLKLSQRGVHGMRNETCIQPESGRRRFFQTALAGAVAGLAGHAGFELAVPKKVGAQSNLSPDAALKELLEGNERFAANQLTSIAHDLAILKEKTVAKQEPFAAVLSCADSRVPVELIFDQTIGHIFVTRVAGNLATPEIIGSLEYGVAVLGVKAIVVLGHSACGAVKAAMKAEAVPGQISTLYARLHQAVDRAGGDFDKAIEANAKIQAELLRSSSTVIRDALKASNLRVEAGVYDLASGKVTLS